MKLKTITLVCLMATSISAFAIDSAASLTATPASAMTILAQRNCTPGDLTIESNSVAQNVMTDCKWQKVRKDSKDPVKDKNGKEIIEDSDMQVTLQVADNVNFVGAHCIFLPSSIGNQGRDQLAGISTSKAGTSDNTAWPTQLPAGKWLSYVTNEANGKTDMQAIIVNYKNSHDINNPSHSHINVLFDLNKNRNASWTGNISDISFNENNTIKCVFTPNALPGL